MAKIIADSKKKDRICSELELIISKQELYISELKLAISELQKRLTYYENPHSPPNHKTPFHPNKERLATKQNQIQMTYLKNQDKNRDTRETPTIDDHLKQYTTDQKDVPDVAVPILMILN